MAKVRKKNRLVRGVGVNDADYAVTPTVDGKAIYCPYYAAWVSMLQRCYCPKYQAKYPTYKDCTVDPNWLSFMSFKVWMETQDWVGKALDKDIISPGNKHYSPATCVFVSTRVNLLLTDCAASRGLYPVGVSWHREKNKFRAYCHDGSGKLKHLGYFDNEEAASAAYVEYKTALITTIANQQTDRRIHDGLLLHAQLLRRLNRR